jgi:hypothetical protein
MINGFGFFITHHPNTLDQHGEWYYNKTTRKLRVYTSQHPSNYVIQAATRNVAIKFQNKSDITIKNLVFAGSNVDHIQMFGGGSARITFLGTEFLGAGSKVFNSVAVSGGINRNTSTDWTFDGVLVRDALNYGWDFRNMGDRLRVTNSTIKQVANIRGMNASLDAQSSTVINSNSGNNHQFDDLVIDSIGYIGIKCTGNNNSAQRNHISNYCMTLDDGGAIYWGYQSTQFVKTGNIIRHNIIHEGHSQTAGTNSVNSFSHGIYLDDNANGVSIWDNSVHNTAGAGLFFHNNWNVSALRNTIVGGLIGLGMQHDAPDHAIELDTIMYNKFVAKNRVSTGGPYVVQYNNYNNNDATNGELTTIGKIDSNWYSRLTEDSTNATTGTFILTHVANDGLSTFSTVRRTLSNWRSVTPYDDNTKQPPIQHIGANFDDVTRFDYNYSAATITVPISQQYKDLEGNTYNPPNYPLAAYSSKFLIETGEEPPPVVIPSFKVYLEGTKVVIFENKVVTE